MYAYLAVLLFAGAAIADVVPVEDCGKLLSIKISQRLKEVVCVLLHYHIEQNDFFYGNRVI